MLSEGFKASQAVFLYSRTWSYSSVNSQSFSSRFLLNNSQVLFLKIFEKSSFFNLLIGLMIISSNNSFLVAISIILSSAVYLLTNLKTLTVFDYPILCALLIAYKSLQGLKSLSVNMMVSALVRLIPNPPALVDNKNILDLASFRLKLSIIFYLSIIPVLPSRRSHAHPLRSTNSYTRSSIIVN